jgi:hypothetical protein
MQQRLCKEGKGKLRAGSHGVLIHGGKVPTFEPQETIKIWLITIKVGSCLFYSKKLVGLVL